MIARPDNLRKRPAVFGHLTGLTVAAFDAPAGAVVPAVEAAHRQRLDRPDRQRATGGGDDFDLSTADRVLLTVVRLRQYPTTATLGFLFGVSDSTAGRARARCLPAPGQAGQDTLRMPDPGAARRQRLPALLADTPGLAVGIDTFEQRTHRPRRRQRAYYSGKKRAHPLKSQVGVDEESGRFADVSDSVPGPWADIQRLKKSRLLKRLPPAPGGPRGGRPAGAPGAGPAAGGPEGQPGVQPAAARSRARDRPAAAVPGGGARDPPPAGGARGAGAGDRRGGQPDARPPNRLLNTTGEGDGSHHPYREYGLLVS